ncbi:hypothetical protein HID58_079908, partial [Brassica napus]
TSDTEIEDGIESTRVSPAKKRKNRFRDTGAESRKKRLLCQRSTDKYRDLEEEMKLEVREFIEDRFIKLEEKILSSQTQGGAPANTQTRGADPFWTPSAATANAPAPTEAPPSVSARAPAPTPASTKASASVSTRGLAPSRSAASAPSRSRASATAHTGGPANTAKTRSQTKHLRCQCRDPRAFTEDNGQPYTRSEEPSAFTTPMTSFRPEIFKTPFLIDSDDLEVRCKAKDYELVFLPEEKWAKLIEWTFNPTVLQIGPSTFDAELAWRIIGPNIWLKNFFSDVDFSVLGCSILAANIRVIEYNRLWFIPTRPTRKFLKPDPKPGSTHPQTQKLKEKVDLEITRVAQEMKQKLKIVTVAMVVVGA